MSSLDQQAHAESQILDANRLCRELLVPLALPWNYPEQALDATTPLDLDDLPMLAEDELGDHEISRSVLESTDAVGVMHLNSYVVHPSHFRALNHLVPSDPSSAKIENFAGKMALTQYEAVMSRKRKMEELESPGTVLWTLFVDVVDRFSSFSRFLSFSRHTIVSYSVLPLVRESR